MTKFPYRQLSEIIETVSVRGHQVKTEAYDDGEGWPIVDQGQDLICGYTNRVEPIDCELPVTVFGDHTRETKFIDFPFVAGADGTKVLRGDNVDPRYFHALIEMAAEEITSLGYARHYKLISEFDSPFTDDLQEQQRIGSVLQGWDKGVDHAERLVACHNRRLEWIIRQVLSGEVRLPSYSKPWVKTSLADVLVEHKLQSTGREVVHSVSVHRGLINQVEHLGRSFAAASTEHYNRVRPGDIVYTKSPTGDFPLGVVKQSTINCDAIVSPLYGVFAPSNRSLGVILDALFSIPAISLRYLSPLVQKGAKNTISVTNSQFLQGKIPLPTDEAEFEELANLIIAQRALIAGAEQELSHLRKQRQGLMRDLTSGVRRVPKTVESFAQRPKVSS